MASIASSPAKRRKTYKTPLVSRVEGWMKFARASHVSSSEEDEVEDADTGADSGTEDASEVISTKSGNKTPKLPRVPTKWTQRGPEFEDHFEGEVRQLESATTGKGAVHEALVRDRAASANEGVAISECKTDAKEWQLLRNTVLSQLKSRKPCKLVGLTEQKDQLVTLLEHTIRDREGTSVIVVGPRGAGKTALVNSALAKIDTEYADEYILIRINGSIQLDEKIAIREILKQLEVRIAQLAGESSLLTGSFERKTLNETMSRFLRIVQEAGSGQYNIPIVFVIDEFDAFLADSKQTLLYNLFDLSQGAGHSITPVSVIGVTTKTDARESLEKRVKSRFSQQLIRVSRPKTLSQYREIVMQQLLVDKTIFESNLGVEFNNYIVKQLTTVGTYLRRKVTANFYTTKDLRELKNWLVPAICDIPTKLFPEFPEGLFQRRLSIQEVVMNSLSDLELKLLICGCRCIAKNELQYVNFGMCYDEYSAMAKQAGSEMQSKFTNLEYSVGLQAKFPVRSKELCQSSWEKLIQDGLIMDVVTYRGELTNGGSNANAWIAQDSKTYYFEVDLQELKTLMEKKNDANLRWCRLN
ncbi:unnamed protein product [Kuraishia capsulata CBS 1993]|uniref:Origin recognition complex subunit 4 n=1 Tax=Kuraishia capsulata CBS 1993 TaxID=1382522 RepID=W6MRX6_9ASCO|nr:uncharacterized protein KUCA_T00005125001 [Kuraishia capsulata CBS 1993]CDK29138.1 unnamed protein product [Kuraishia capsulata CBS 1993]